MALYFDVPRLVLRAQVKDHQVGQAAIFGYPKKKSPAPGKEQQNKLFVDKFLLGGLNNKRWENQGGKNPNFIPKLEALYRYSAIGSRARRPPRAPQRELLRKAAKTRHRFTQI